MNADCINVARPGAKFVVGFHAITGSADHVVDLGRHLPDGWGLVACTSESVAPDHIPATVPELAAAYVDAVVDRVGGSALVVGGWGFGGAVAVEAQRLLHLRGRAPIGMFAIGT